MQKCFLVANKATQVSEYLEHRSIVEVTEEHRSLIELDLNRLGIIDVDKFIYLYYASDDGDLAFRSDLNVLRQLLSTAFFHAGEAIFILVGCSNPMLEDLIHSACRDSQLIGSKLNIIHHSGTLTLNDVSRYIAGFTVGSQTQSSYKSVFIREEDSEEKERYTNDPDGLEAVLPVLTDHYAMYKRRADVEAVSSARTVTDTRQRPQILHNFSKIEEPTIKRWSAFLLSGAPYTKFELGVDYLLDYFGRVGFRCLVVDLTCHKHTMVFTTGSKTLGLGELTSKTALSEQSGYLKCRPNQLGYLVEMLDNLEGIHVLLFVTDEEEYVNTGDFIEPLCGSLYRDFVTHFSEAAVEEYLDRGYSSTTLFLSRAAVSEDFDLKKYKEAFGSQRVALLATSQADTTEFYECAVGGVKRE